MIRRSTSARLFDINRTNSSRAIDDSAYSGLDSLLLSAFRFINVPIMFRVYAGILSIVLIDYGCEEMLLLRDFLEKLSEF